MIGKKEKIAQKGKLDFIKWFSELNKNSGNIVGGKGANLAEIYNLKIPAPQGFVITAQAYDYFIEKAGLKEKIKEFLKKIDYENTKQLEEITKEIRTLINDSKFPKEMEEDILEAYENLDVKEIDIKEKTAHDILKSSSEPIFVAVRSSATTEDLAEASFAGQQDSFLNVKGKSDLLKNIKKCFGSLFTARATYYRNKKGFKHEQASLAVIVQKMIDSDKSGVIFTKDPSYKNDNVIIEAVWGLGEGIVSGRITPDQYIISKELKILKKNISDKKIAITRDSGGNKEIVKLREEKSKHQVLKEYEIKKLVEFGIKLEEHYKKPQDIEFAIEGEEIYIVQTRPITTLEKNIERSKEIQGEVILEGLAASPGIGVGKIKIIEHLEDLHKINQGDVLVTKMTNPDMVVTMQKCAAIVTDRGGLTAHAAIVSREMGIPAIVGTHEATTKLKNGEVITVDGFTGKIYKGKVSETIQKEILPVTTKTKTKIKIIIDLPSFAEHAAKAKIKQAGLVRIEGIIAESEKHPNYFLKEGKIQEYEEIIFKGIKKISQYFDNLWVRTSDIRSDEFQNLKGSPKEKEANPMLGMHGIRYGIKNPKILKSELKALKKVASYGKEIGILLPQVISVDEIKKTKEFLQEVNFTEAKIGVMIETPAAVQLIGEFCKEGIDFISFGTNDLTQYMLAIDRGNEKVQELYDEMHPAILYQLEYVIRVCKRNNVETSICGQAGSKKEMAKFLVERGIDSISVNADAASEIANYILKIENELVMNTDKEPRQYQPKKETKEEFTKPQQIIPENTEKKERSIDNIKDNVETGLENIKEFVKEGIEDKRGEAPLIPGVEKTQKDENSKYPESSTTNNDYQSKTNEKKEHKEEIEQNFVDDEEPEFKKDDEILDIF